MGRAYKCCPYCDAHLDFGEVCDCQTETGRKEDEILNKMKYSFEIGSEREAERTRRSGGEYGEKQRKSRQWGEWGEASI